MRLNAPEGTRSPGSPLKYPTPGPWYFKRLLSNCESTNPLRDDFRVVCSCSPPMLSVRCSFPAAFLGAFSLFINIAGADILVPAGATWKYLRGTAEASSPDATLWRTRTFDDSAWLDGAMPFWYGDVLPGGT